MTAPGDLVPFLVSLFGYVSYPCQMVARVFYNPMAFRFACLFIQKSWPAPLARRCLYLLLSLAEDVVFVVVRLGLVTRFVASVFLASVTL